MHKLLEEILSNDKFRDIAKKFFTPGEFLLFGLAGSQKTFMTAAAFALKPRPFIIIISDRNKFQEWQADFAELLPGVEVVELPELDLINVQASTIGIELQA